MTKRLDLSASPDNDRDAPDPSVDPEFEQSALDEMTAAEDAEQGLSAKRRPKRVRVRRKP